MKKLTKYLLGITLLTLVLGTTSFAAETDYTVTPVSAIGKTNTETVVLDKASSTANIVLTKENCPDNVDICITGVTSNGYWEIDLGQSVKYYCIGSHLDLGNTTSETTAVSNPAELTEIEKTVKFIAENVRHSSTPSGNFLTYYIYEAFYNANGKPLSKDLKALSSLDALCADMSAHPDEYANAMMPVIYQHVVNINLSGSRTSTLRFNVSTTPAPYQTEVDYGGYHFVRKTMNGNFKIICQTPEFVDWLANMPENTYYTERAAKQAAQQNN